MPPPLPLPSSQDHGQTPIFCLKIWLSAKPGTWPSSHNSGLHNGINQPLKDVNYPFFASVDEVKH